MVGACACPCGKAFPQSAADRRPPRGSASRPSSPPPACITPPHGDAPPACTTIHSTPFSHIAHPRAPPHRQINESQCLSLRCIAIHCAALRHEQGRHTTSAGGTPRVAEGTDSPTGEGGYAGLRISLSVPPPASCCRASRPPMMPSDPPSHAPSHAPSHHPIPPLSRSTALWLPAPRRRYPGISRRGDA